MEERSTRKNRRIPTGRENKRTRYNAAAASQGGGRGTVGRQAVVARPSRSRRTPERTTTSAWLQSQNSESKGNLSLWSMNMPLLYAKAFDRSL